MFIFISQYCHRDVHTVLIRPFKSLILRYESMTLRKNKYILNVLKFDTGKRVEQQFIPASVDVYKYVHVLESSQTNGGE